MNVLVTSGDEKILVKNSFDTVKGSWNGCKRMEVQIAL